MSLQVWLPLNGDLENQGLANLDILTPSQNSITFNANGKIGNCGTGTLAWHLTNEILDNTWSVAVWVKATSTFASGNNIIFCKNTNASTDCQIYFSIINGASLNVGVNGLSSSLSQSYTFVTNTWYHVAATYDGSIVSLYINGIFQKSTTVTTAKPEGRLNIRINGRSTNAANTSQTGYLAGYNFNDFRLYDHCLSTKEIEEIARGLVLHYKLDDGNPNLIDPSYYTVAPWAAAITGREYDEEKGEVLLVRNNTLYTQSSNGANPIFPITFAENTQYTLSVDWRDVHRTDSYNSSMYLRFWYNDGTHTEIISPASSKTEWTHQTLVSSAGKTITKITTTYGRGGIVSIANLKIEVGVHETKKIGQDNVIYDSSGYGHNGITIGTVLSTQSSPRYDASIKLNGSSAVKCTSNTWMAQQTEEITINIWVKPTASFTKLFSCTETGGWNTEGGTSGYLRFPLYVYTNEARTSRAYMYDSKEILISSVPLNEWTMISFVYDSTGTKTYINGELHHTYTRTSYGIYYNLNARLFLGCEANTANPSSPYFTGQMSDFRIYATALTPAAIQELYHTSATIDKSGNVYAREVVEI